MDPILQVLLSWQFIFFCLAIAAVVFVIRTVVEYIAGVAKKDISKSKLWNDLILPLVPVVLGAVSAFFLKLFPYPGFADGPKGYVITGDRIIFGLVAGLLSTLVYRVIKSLLYQKMVDLTQNLQNANSSPAGPTTTVTTLTVNNQVPTTSENIAASEISPRGKL